MSELVVAEVFGPTVQGEGPSTGRRATFVRLGLCNLDCGAGAGAAWACDTPYTWDWTGKLGTPFNRDAELRHVEHDALAADVVARGAELVVLTGGEPLLQQRHLVDLVPLFAAAELDVEVETNGTCEPRAELHGWTFNVSPKLASSGVARSRAWKPDVLAVLRDLDARFKFVAASLDDLDEITELVDLVGIPDRQVWVMPAGTDPALLTARGRALVGATIDRGWNITGRLHVQLWGNRRGV